MKNTLLYFFTILIIFTFFSCDGGGDGKVVFYSMDVQFDKELFDVNKGSQIPSNLASILNYINIKDESKECFGKYYVPEIVYTRNDLNEKFEQDFPINEGFLMSKITMTKGELNENYNLELLKIPKLLIKPSISNISRVKKQRVKKNTFTLNLYEEDNNKIELLKGKIKKSLCAGAKSITILVNDDYNEIVIQNDQEKIDNIIKEADALFEQGKLVEAKQLYEKVLLINSDNVEIEKRITVIVEEIKKKDENKQLLQLTEEADNLYKQKKYKEARTLYYSIKDAYSNNKHALRRINEINKLLVKTPPEPKNNQQITTDNSIWVKVNNGKYNSDYATYEGGIVNGKMDGQGTMVFIKSHLIPVPEHSKKRITASKGDKLAGSFKNGSFDNGHLYNSRGEKKESIIIGR